MVKAWSSIANRVAQPKEILDIGVCHSLRKLESNPRDFGTPTNKNAKVEDKNNVFLRHGFGTERVFLSPRYTQS